MFEVGRSFATARLFWSAAFWPQTSQAVQAECTPLLHQTPVLCRRDTRKSRLLDRAFLARQQIWLLSLARSHNFLDLEDLHRLSYFLAVTTDYSEDGHGDRILGETALLSLLHLLVEEPLVDLYPREPGSLDGPLALLAIDFASLSLAILIQSHEVADLIAAFAQTVGLSHVVTACLSHALSRDER